ncbi:MAG: ATP-binding protein [Sutterellaceae bacterium]|nr:ATP-binding protein [Sutterellaceae bacterium]MDD7441437.1 ATP-binding protein [Sutterellaceae bacterium]MDY2868253.1 ATP-binding protein [Mesosutterella sp.]
MRKRILRGMLFAAFLVLLIVGGSALLILFEASVRATAQGLESDLWTASAAYEKFGQSGLVLWRDKKTPQITLIEKSGNVILDTRKNADEMENHGNRPEVREALESGHGSAVRYSTTVLEQNVYRAMLLPDGRVLRVSEASESSIALFLRSLPWILAAAGLAAIAAVIMAKRLTESIVRPIARIRLDRPLEGSDVDPELMPILEKLDRETKTAANQGRELARKTQELRRIISSMKEGLLLAGTDGSVQFMNGAAQRLLPGVRTGINLDLFEREGGIRRAFSEARSKGRAILRRNSSSGRVLQWNFSRIDSNEGTIGVVILLLDISDRVLAEQRRREFTANVSHELRTPLTTVMAGADLIASGLAAPEDAPRIAGRIKRESERLLFLIENIMRLSKIEEGEVKPEACELSGILSEVVSELEAKAKRRHIIMTLETEPCTLMTVPHLFFEVARNLVENAVKYNIDGGRVEVSLSKLPDGAELRVSDTGVGISDNDQERVFERFYRADTSHSSATEGNGIGLSIVKHACELLGGVIHMKSALGHGTTITVRLPAVLPKGTEGKKA